MTATSTEVQAVGELQWGRTRSSAEILEASPWSIEVNFASMGPHSFECGNLTACERSRTRRRRFNGAALVRVRKSRGILFRRTYDELASMGPHSFECGNGLFTEQAKKAGYRLQWGRTRSSAEIARRAGTGAAHRPLAASMGPHSFECGNLIRCKAFVRGHRWLQWGRTRSSAEMDTIRLIW